ncbi:MAG: L-threonylcarbamoyladenylate synthase [Pseudomonadota bacterium]
MPIDTQTLVFDSDSLRRAAGFLRAGGLVAFPTETVYGLGADARNDHAVARIFDVKGRPEFNPLIVHIARHEDAVPLVNWSPIAERLATAFWPGPLTLVLPLATGAVISPLVTAGLPTLAIRMPDHPLAASLLHAFGAPVAAPSANISGRLSPTNAAHVARNLSGRIEAILDGGPCPVGLESTIISLGETPRLLRPGGLPVEVIEEALGLSLAAPGDAINAPGQLASHYAPRAVLRLNASKARGDERMLGFGPVPGDLTLSSSGDLVEAAAQLFGHLHALDAGEGGAIAVAPIPDRGLGRAINDRLRRAAAPRDL